MKHGRPFILQTTAALAAWLSLAPAGRACAVCFGDSSQPMVRGMNLAILTMLLITVAVLAGFAAFIVHLARKSAAAAAAQSKQPRNLGA